MTLPERYAEYMQRYDAYVARCNQAGEQPLPPCPRPEAGFHALRATKSVPMQLKELDALRKRGVVKTSPPLPAVAST